MVMKKRLAYGSNGFRFPVVPRAPRSSRRRYIPSKEDNQICAFELLAAVAGKLLLESESSASSNATEGKEGPAMQTKPENYKDHKVFSGLQPDHKVLKSECLDQGSCVESAISPLKAEFQEQKIKNIPMGSVRSSHSENIPMSEKVSCIKFKSPTDGIVKCEVEGVNIDSPTENITVTSTCTVKDPINHCLTTITPTTNNNKTLNNSDYSVKMPLYRDSVPSVSYAKRRSDVKLGIRDDDENSFRCYKRSGTNKIRALRQRARIGCRKTRKMQTSSRRWQVTPRLKECELSDRYKAVKVPYGNRKRTFAQERCLAEYSPKRRKLGSRSFAITYDQEVSSESVSNLPAKQISGGDDFGSAVITHKGSGTSSSVKSLQNYKDPNVKFSIKSFRVPELYIEVPENATVGSLKKTVMEAVTTILNGSLRVGVVLHGKKVRDDGRTLQQAGISQNSDLDALGFTLEPSMSQVSSSSPKDHPAPFLAVAGPELSNGIQGGPNLDLALSANPLNPSPEFKLDTHAETNPEPVQLLLDGPVGVSMSGACPESRALVAVQPMDGEVLAAVPVNHKSSRRSELSQRRARRPFSVSEVEALVEAVEQLGTGRWRDVKIRAFDNADHRTYVDLKDKWKTLVHTASIAPQQRRGEPVPQELLDRVLAAHSYWSQHQAKQHGKPPVHAEPVMIADAPVQAVQA
ncbi:unnamed protein product [Cuscuta epithymum]|uniref:Telomere repeat-binding protein 3 n=1 Tax=Cuscuta epithymum TaxID=186058 RepID=A0AAV0G0D5_9ASTE|nr:unnamed protein product [Cuscuta epithymum]CAH9140759.1 unnamed protein product [Cuscuta epithymum]